MADQLQFRGGTTAEYGSFVGADREITVDTTLKALRIHDGSTTGGHLVINKADVETLIAALQTSSSYNLAQENTARTEAIATVTAALNAAIAARDAADVATLTTAQSYADTAVSNIVGGAPGLLDTLNELAAAIGDDEDFITTITSANTVLSGRIDTLEVDPTTASAVSAVSTALTAETSARTSADTNLSGRLDTLESDPITASAVASSVATEAANRATGDTNEASTRGAADLALQAAIDAAATADSAARAILQAAIDTINIDRTQLEERLLHAGLSTGNLYVTNFTGG